MVVKHYGSSKTLRQGLWNTLFSWENVTGNLRKTWITTAIVNHYAVVFLVWPGPLGMPRLSQQSSFSTTAQLSRRYLSLLESSFVWHQLSSPLPSDSKWLQAGKNYFRIIFGGSTGKSCKSPRGCCRGGLLQDRGPYRRLFLGNCFRGLYRKIL